MADTTITDLPNAATLDGTERVPIDQAGVTKDCSTQQIAGLAGAAISAAVAAHAAAADPHSGYLLETDPAVTNARQPLSHRASHAIGGSDALTPADIGAATAAQGAKADTAVQPGQLGGAASLNVGTTAGTVAAGDDARITGALQSSTAASTYQPLDSDLTAIAELSTTAFGRSLLTQADAAAARSALGAGTGNGTVTAVTGTAPIVSSGGATPVISISSATTSAAGSMSAVDKTKLDGIAAGATANATDAQLRDRSTHTGSQPGSTVTGAYTASGLTLNTARLLGRTSAGSGAAEEISISGATLSGGVLTITGGATNLSYTASTRALTSSTGTGVTLPLFTSADAGLAPASGGGTTNFLRADGTWAAPAGTGGGTVNSVGLSLPSIFSVSGSPVTSTGTLTGTLVNQNANVVLAGPATGGAAAPTFRALVAADLPNTPVTAGSYGAAGSVATFTVDAQGRLTTAGSISISIGTAQVVGFTATAAAAAPVQSVAGRTGAITLGVGDISGAAASGAIGSSGLTMNTARLLGRTSAGTGAPEEISLGSGLSLSGNTLSATGGGGTTFGGYAVGNFVVPITGALAAGQTLSANQIALSPFEVRRAVAFSDLLVRVTTAAAASTFQLAIYGSANGIHTGTPIWSTTGTGLSGGTVGLVTATLSGTLQAGIYWLAINSDGTPTFLSVAANNTYQSSLVGSSSASEVLTATGTTFHCRVFSQTYGTWPDLTGVTSTIPTSNQRRVPAFALLVSALP